MSDVYEALFEKRLNKQCEKDERDWKVLWEFWRDFIDLADVIYQLQTNDVVLCETSHSVYNIIWSVLSLKLLNKPFREDYVKHVLYIQSEHEDL